MSADIAPPPFWLVWSPQGITPPTFRHPSLGSARDEAHRLAHENPGREFFVVEPASRYVVPRAPMAVAQYESDPDDRVPF